MKNLIKEILTDYYNAAVHLFLFKTYTVFPRILEIAYGIIAWLCTLLIVYAIIK